MYSRVLLLIVVLLSSHKINSQSIDSIIEDSSKVSLISPNYKVDYLGFLQLGDSLAEFRFSRLIDEQKFVEFIKDASTIVLDTRSLTAYRDIHVKGAMHINFSDFTEEKLAEKIPDKSTRILIYCNNNFLSNRASFFDKSPKLALNIPTFINLVGYGYTNVYELGVYISENETTIPLEMSEEFKNKYGTK